MLDIWIYTFAYVPVKELVKCRLKIFLLLLTYFKWGAITTLLHLKYWNYTTALSQWRETEARCSGYLTCNVNKHCSSHSLAISKKSLPSASTETVIFDFGLVKFCTHCDCLFILLQMVISGVADLFWIFRFFDWLSKLRMLVYICTWCLILKYYTLQIWWKLENVFFSNCVWSTRPSRWCQGWTCFLSGRIRARWGFLGCTQLICGVKLLLKS